MQNEIIDVEVEDITTKKKKLFITNFQAPGDILMLTSAVRDLYHAHSDRYSINVNTTAMQIWENNPYLDESVTEENADITIKTDYSLVHKSNQQPWHFIHGFRQDLERKLGIIIPQGDFKPDIHISDLEKSWIPQVQEVTGKDLKYWIVCAGTKNDFTAKMWEFKRFQTVINHFKNKIVFVQIGEVGHGHPALENVIDLRGKTDTRELIRLFYHSVGVLCGVSFPMHLSAAIETRGDRCFKTRPAVIIAGGREPAHWEAYSYHRYLNRCSSLPCCDLGGCWKSRVIPLSDGNEEQNKSLCCFPVETKSHQVIPKCLDMISTGDVIRAIDTYRIGYKDNDRDFHNEGFILTKFLKNNPQYNGKQNGNDINNCEWMKEIFPVSVLMESKKKS